MKSVQVSKNHFAYLKKIIYLNVHLKGNFVTLITIKNTIDDSYIIQTQSC